MVRAAFFCLFPYFFWFARSYSLTVCTTGKTTFFVANQANLEDMPSEKLSGLEAEFKEIDEQNKALQMEVRAATMGKAGYMRFSWRFRQTDASLTELAKIKSTPTDDELASQLDEAAASVHFSSFKFSRLFTNDALSPAHFRRSRNSSLASNPFVPAHRPSQPRNSRNWTASGQNNELSGCAGARYSIRMVLSLLPPTLSLRHEVFVTSGSLTSW